MSDTISDEYKPSGEGPIDFAIMTALQVERDAMVSRLDRHVCINVPGNPYMYFHGEIDLPGGGHYKVVVTKLIDPGNLSAAVETVALVKRWQPKSLLMVGIAGGVGQAGIEKGQVVVAETVYYYEPGKKIVEGEQRRPTVYRCDRILLAKAKNYEAADWKAEVNISPPEGSETHVPRASFGPIGCGEQVIADEETIPRLLAECPKMLAVAMEGAGVAQAAENEQTNFLEIRGISDLANPVKDDQWHEYAANVAAAFARGFIRSKPVYPVSEVERFHSGNSVTSSPLVILRLQSQRKIGADEIMEALPSEIRGHDHETVGLDFTGLVIGGKLVDPEAAAASLANTQGELMRALSQRGVAEFIFHGHAHIPLLILAGFLTTDRQPVRLYDFHPTTHSWQWPATGQPYPKLEVRGLPDHQISRSGYVVLRFSVSYSVNAKQTRAVSLGRPVLEVDINLSDAHRDVIMSEEQVYAYGKTFREVIDQITQRVPNAQRIHLCYAGPVTLAFHLGQQISENIHPPVVAWNYSRIYEWGIDLALAVAGEPSVVWPTA